jgi:hypothetical protein
MLHINFLSFQLIYFLLFFHFSLSFLISYEGLRMVINATSRRRMEYNLSKITIWVENNDIA